MLKSSQIPTAHTDAVVCCGVHPGRKVLLSGGEDASLCFADLSSNTIIGKITQKEGEAVTSIVCSPTEEHTVFASADAAILKLDLRRSLGEEAIVDTYRINQDEINSLSIDSTGRWLAAADDTGEIQVITLGGAGGAGSSSSSSSSTSNTSKPVHKTLRRGHDNICSSVAFRPHRAMELVSGGLDCRLVRWDFTKIRQLHSWDMTSETMTGNGYIFNPPMVNAVAVPVGAEVPYTSLVAVARGDGCIVLYDGDFRPPAQTNSASKGKLNKSSNSKAGARGSSSKTSSETEVDTGVRWMSDILQGGHTAAANCVCFTSDSGGRRLFSVGNDAKVCLWSWEEGIEPVASLKHRSKINWVCSAGGEAGVDAVIGDVRGKLTAISAPS